MSMKVLVIGSGGREHALAWKLAQSIEVAQVLVAPGNAGTNGSGKIQNTDVNVKNFKGLAAWCHDNGIGLVVVGPEDPLALGIVDALNEADILCFGPSADCAQIEASKEYAKTFMDRYKIPTARWQAFTDYKAAEDFINSAPFPALVVKASGLAAGKGVVVAKNRAVACAAAREMLQNNAFGAAGSVVVIEELLEGEEISVLAFCDGQTVACFPPAQDHKRIYEGDNGPNTGGMGAYCPYPMVSESDLEVIRKQVLQRAVNGMKAEGKPYQGILYAGMMLTKDGPKTLEFNCRFGDPETQVLLPLLKSDLCEVMLACVLGNLNTYQVEFEDELKAVAVVLVSEGYPGTYQKGHTITESKTAEIEHSNIIFHAGTTFKNGEVVTNGGRVLATVALDRDLARAANQAQRGAQAIHFKGKSFRKDIAHKALKKLMPSITYKSSGVDIGAGDALVDAIKPMAKATSRSGCTAELGQFGGLFDVTAAGYKDPLLVSGTDGVGTKLKIAQICGIHDTMGIDLVAMCVNDILCHGAEPLFFLDYFACGKLDVDDAKDVIAGVAHGCQIAGCALLGGETAEMPGMYAAGEYDLAGFTVGAVERQHYLPRVDDIVEGDILIGVPSSGVHSNGFSLVRKVVEHAGLDFKVPCPWEPEKSLGEVLLTPTKIYCGCLLRALRSGKVKAMAHITGGGLPGNITRVLPDGLVAVFGATEWEIPPTFGWIQAKGNVSMSEMAKTFNLGLGIVLVVSHGDGGAVMEMIESAGESPRIVGVLEPHKKGADRVEIVDLESELLESWSEPVKHPAPEPADSSTVKKSKQNGHHGTRRKVGVLISGSGTNLQALIDYTQDPKNSSSAEIVLVISNKPDVQGLKRAAAAGIKTEVINHKDFSGRKLFDAAVHDRLVASGVEIVCLAGFMRILTGEFVNKWKGRMLNVHPSLLPAFKGSNAHKLVLESGVRISGCTVHYVAEEIDSGAILAQDSVPVYPGDTEAALQERIKLVEHKLFPQALEMVASGNAELGPDGKIQWKC